MSLMDKLSKYIAYRCKPNSSKFREYWVPIEMANLQVEQYCATFISNAAILCGTHKSNCVAGLRDVIISSRKVGLLLLSIRDVCISKQLF